MSQLSVCLRQIRLRAGLLDPAVADRFRALSREVIKPMVAIAEDQQLVFVTVPKAAHSSILSVMASGVLRRRVSPEDMRLPWRRLGLKDFYDLGPRAFFDLVDDPQTIVFTVVRNPFDRLASGYSNKFASNAISTEPLDSAIRRYFGARLASLNTTLPLPLPWFVDYATATCGSPDGDAHWRLMSKIVPAKAVKVGLVAKVEDLKSDLEPVFHRLGDDISLLKANPSRSDSVRLTPDLEEKVRTAYAEDFERFSYPFER